MTQSPNYSAVIAEGLVEPYGSGRSWTQPSLLMPDDKGSRSGSSPDREPFITIDDLLHKAQELFVGLRKLSGYKHPLDVRRGVRKSAVKVKSQFETQSEP